MKTKFMNIVKLNDSTGAEIENTFRDKIDGILDVVANIGMTLLGIIAIFAIVILFTTSNAEKKKKTLTLAGGCLAGVIILGMHGVILDFFLS